MEKKLITITEDELWIWRYYEEGGTGSPESSGDEVVLSSPTKFSDFELEPSETQSSTEVESDQEYEHTLDNYWIRRFKEEEARKPSPTKTAQRIIADQRFLHILKMQEDENYRTSYNTMLQRNRN